MSKGSAESFNFISMRLLRIVREIREIANRTLIDVKAYDRIAVVFSVVTL